MVKDLGKKVLLLDDHEAENIYCIKQFDDIKISFNLYKKDLPFNCENQSLILKIKKPNNGVKKLSGFVINKNNIQIYIPGTVFNAAGINKCEIKISDNMGSITTPTFAFKVIKIIEETEPIVIPTTKTVLITTDGKLFATSDNKLIELGG